MLPFMDRTITEHAKLQRLVKLPVFTKNVRKIGTFSECLFKQNFF